MLHSTYTHWDQVDSRLLVVRSQTASLTLGPSFNHNLCCKCPNGSCEAILNIYTLRPFQRYNKHLNARCFVPCNRALNFWESRRTPKSHFRECEWQPHTSLKVGLRQFQDFTLGVPGKNAIWMQVRRRSTENTIWGKVVASPESGPW